MRTILLTQGKVALVDDADFEAVSQFKWHAQKRRQGFYAARNIRKPDGKRAVQSLHQFLMPGVPEIHHRDGDGLNNQRDNLRSVTHKQNLRGVCRKKRGATSKFRGVSWDKNALKWKACIGVDGKVIYLGCFDSEEGAGRARDKATLKYYGPGAYLNFP